MPPSNAPAGRDGAAPLSGWRALGTGMGLAALLALVPTPAASQLVASPLGLSLSVAAGEEQTASLQVYNHGPGTQSVELGLVDWFRTPAGLRYYPAGTLPRSLAPWLRFLDPTSFSLAPGERRELRFVLAVPPAVEGSHWTLILLQGGTSPSPPPSSDQTTLAVQVQAAYAIKVIQTDPATAAPAATLLELAVTQTDPFSLSALVENTGNVHLLPRGWAEVRDDHGRTLKRLDIPQFGVLPGEVRAIRVRDQPASPQLAPGDYLVVVVLDFAGPYLAAAQKGFTVP